jgi:hypothetical protein
MSNFDLKYSMRLVMVKECTQPTAVQEAVEEGFAQNLSIKNRIWVPDYWTSSLMMKIAEL